MDDFIDTGSGGGVGFGLCEDITHAVIDEEIITSPRRYHTITESKNGEGATPIKTEKGWLHIAHGVRNTAAGLRYVIYVFVTALDDPSKVIAEPSGFTSLPGIGSVWAMSPTWSLPTARLQTRTAACIFIMRPATPVSM